MYFLLELQALGSEGEGKTVLKKKLLEGGEGRGWEVEWQMVH